MIEVLIVNESQLMCSVIAFALRQEPDIEVIGSVTNMEQALERQLTQGVMLVNATLPDQGALKLTTKINKRYPDVYVVVTGLPESPSKIMQYVEAGAAGYVLNEVDLDDLLEKVRAAPEGKAYASPEMVAHLMSRVAELAELCMDKDGLSSAIQTLTPREEEILALINQGLTNQEISEQLTIEVGTVKNHVHNVLNKLGVASRQEAAELYQQVEAE